VLEDGQASASAVSLPRLRLSYLTHENGTMQSALHVPSRVGSTRKAYSLVSFIPFIFVSSDFWFALNG
jgi:hypothetical protein